MEYLKKQIDLPHYDVVGFYFSEDKQSISTLNEQVDITANNYASITGKRMFVTPNIISRLHTKLKPSEKRKYPIALGMDYIDVDTTVIEIPEGYQLESLPSAFNIDGKFGKFASSTELKENKIYYYRRMERIGGEFPAAELVKFYDQIYKTDRSRVVLIKKE